MYKKISRGPSIHGANDLKKKFSLTLMLSKSLDGQQWMLAEKIPEPRIINLINTFLSNHFNNHVPLSVNEQMAHQIQNAFQVFFYKETETILESCLA